MSSDSQYQSKSKGTDKEWWVCDLICPQISQRGEITVVEMEAGCLHWEPLTCVWDTEPVKMIRPTTWKEHSYHLKGLAPYTLQVGKIPKGIDFGGADGLWAWHDCFTSQHTKSLCSFHTAWKSQHGCTWRNQSLRLDFDYSSHPEALRRHQSLLNRDISTAGWKTHNINNMS